VCLVMALVMGCGAELPPRGPACSCVAIECGDDACGRPCGDCAGGLSCVLGLCLPERDGGALDGR